ncbi:MAG: hypothetical protein JWO85_376 [Candidatus Eremiobacteraeota bacterium]|jgi:uncharacterized protein YdhG (YjbR/CyaY superfamily)|nr:hypothetical protein [Candidatus Eremiobacteraeota bacterium]
MAKGGGAPKTCDDYFAALSEPARSTLEELRATIRALVPPETTEALWYGMPTFKYEGPLLSLGAFTRHCSVFPLSAAVIAAFENELKDFKTSKGTIQFPLDKPPPAALIAKLVKARIAENERKNRR